jgi:hypothetical protein
MGQKQSFILVIEYLAKEIIVIFQATLKNASGLVAGWPQRSCNIIGLLHGIGNQKKATTQ